MKTQKLLGAGLLAAALSVSMTVSAFAEGTFTFYKQVGAAPKAICTLTDSGTQRYNLKAPMNKPCENDEISAAVFENVKPGTTLRVYDNQWGHKTDSWSEVTFKAPHPHYTLASFQSNYEDEVVKVEYHNDNNWMGVHGLNDQISRIEINEGLPNFE